MNLDNFYALHNTTYDIHIFRYIGMIANITVVDKVMKTKFNRGLPFDDSLIPTFVTRFKTTPVE